MPMQTPDRRRVLSVVPRQYLPHLNGGLEITAHEMCRAMLGMDWRVVAAARSPTADRASIADRVLRRVVRRVLGPYQRTEVVGEKGYECSTDLRHPTKLERLVARVRPRVIVCHVAHSDDLVSKICHLVAVKDFLDSGLMVTRLIRPRVSRGARSTSVAPPQAG